jgi:uncharacterized protein
MPESLFPGVYVEEINAGPHPIEGVSTSTAAFLGETQRGPIRPRLICGPAEYARWFGGAFSTEKYLPHAVNGFFENGGKRVFICRLVGKASATAQAAFGDFAVRAIGPGSWGNRIFARVEDSTAVNSDGSSVGFRLRVAYWDADTAVFDPFTEEGRSKVPQPTLLEDFDDLVVDEASPNFYGKRMPFIDLGKGQTNQGPETSALCVLVRSAAADLAAPPSGAGQVLSGGADDASPLGREDYVGSAAGSRYEGQGLAALELDRCRAVALVYAPNASNDVAAEIVHHCETKRFRFAAIDVAQGMSNGSDLDPRAAIPADTSYAAFYYPWIAVSDPATGSRQFVPPGGHILGVYARCDAERGVFKAPANEVLHGVTDLEYEIAPTMQDELNAKGVNVIRRFPRRGIRVWGGRTLSSDPLWKYVNVRRLFIFIEASLYEGVQWVVFEPNDDRLWARVKAEISHFLRAQWQLGALSGRTEQDAFFVACDRTTMTQDDILSGRLICEIGIAPLRPAEFVIFRIVQRTAEAQ